jgi:hypothetical protein
MDEYQYKTIFIAYNTGQFSHELGGYIPTPEWTALKEGVYRPPSGYRVVSLSNDEVNGRHGVRLLLEAIVPKSPYR